MDVVEKLSSLGFELDNYANGKHECLCPFCSAQRKPHHQNQKCAAVWIEDNFATYNCIHCGEHGFINSDVFNYEHAKYTPVTTMPENNAMLAEGFFTKRGISLETLKKAGVYVERKKFKEPMIAFPFYKGTRIVNIKYRGIEEKKFAQEINCEPVVYNYDNVFGKKEIIIVEGEIDALTFIEAGYDNVISIPSGSIGKAVAKDYAGAKFDFLKVSQPLFDIAEKIYLALDSDEPGRLMTQALIERLGREKVMLVDWGQYKVQGKDANDFWLKDKSIIKNAIDTAKPIPLRGIINAADNIENFEQYLRDGTKNAISTGFDSMDNLIKFEYGNFITITGYPGCLHGDTVIRIQREHHSKSIKIKCLYNRFNGFDSRYKWSHAPTYVRRVVDGKIGLYPIENVWYSGYKKLFQLELEDGKKLKATADHKILTDNGYVPFKNLKIGDKVAVDNMKQYGKKGHRHGTNYEETTVGCLHPYARYHKVIDKNGKSYDSWRVPAHRFIYDAYINGMSVEELKARTKVDVTGLKFVDPKTHEIHHKDGNPKNNDISNLVMLTIQEHHMIHNVVERFGQGKVEYSAVKNVTELGYDDVYDIQCVGIPNNEPNFNANGIMVHNCGKSYFATAMIMNMAKQYGMKTLYCAFENSQNQLLKKWCQMLAGRPVVDASEQVIEDIRPYYPFIKEHFYILQDMSACLTVDDLLDMADQAIKQYGVKCMIIDPLNKLSFNKSNNLTEDIGELLSKLISFARSRNIIMFLVAHPTKPSDGSRKLGAQSTPSGFDIAGSANFLNMSDVIITVHRKQDANGVKSTSARVMVSKVRDTDYGHEGSCYFDYNPYTGQYYAIDKATYENSEIQTEDIDF